MNIKKSDIKLALKIMDKNIVKRLSELSEKEFLDKCRKNPKMKNIDENILRMMYKEAVKKAEK